MPCPYRPACGHGTVVPLRVTLCASAIFASFAPSAVFALAPFALRGARHAVPLPPCVWARHRRAPTGDTLCVSNLCVLCSLCGLCVSTLCPSWGTACRAPTALRVGTAPSCPYRPAWRHGIAVPLRVTLCASAIFAPFAPSAVFALAPFALRGARHRRTPTALRGARHRRAPTGDTLCVSNLCVLCSLCGLCVSTLCPSWGTACRAPTALRGGTASPCPYRPSWGTAPSCPYG
ncbi:MAG: hypothetical protein KatS3mg055_0855 [Chloroflexus sp.]|nr:MAG: hypothetical protein KatS3mg055_0855 [Chloroflexus sp.]